uniref:Uncharacterized protein n=1 Tax=Arundo donax TaxID=35708 RepID=A0A0A9G7L0_ARUDO
MPECYQSRLESRFGLCRRNPENPRWLFRSIQRLASARLRCPDGEMHDVRDRRAVVLFIPSRCFRCTLNCHFPGSFAPDGKNSFFFVPKLFD